MPRRPPPTPLRLVSGPLPSRNRPKHTLPSIPHPTFHPRPPVHHTSRPRTRTRSIEDLHSPNPFAGAAKQSERHGGGLGGMGRRGSSESVKSNGSNVSGASSTASRPPCPASRAGKVAIRGPWDHAASIKVPFDVEAVLTPPRAAVVNVAFTR